ncbi:hypothetical protein [Modestobacter marinus]|uniref:hypothetical protein n=1 Tax=Modestobacter marinus TaxID=477641 RepID=UPI001C93E47B|nr:hypothetical protein [Modestobacter marinus]
MSRTSRPVASRRSTRVSPFLSRLRSGTALVNPWTPSTSFPPSRTAPSRSAAARRHRGRLTAVPFTRHRDG